jgi:hypothetical protein
MQRSSEDGDAFIGAPSSICTTAPSPRSRGSAGRRSRGSRPPLPVRRRKPSRRDSSDGWTLLVVITSDCQREAAVGGGEASSDRDAPLPPLGGQPVLSLAWVEIRSSQTLPASEARPSSGRSRSAPTSTAGLSPQSRRRATPPASCPHRPRHRPSTPARPGSLSSWVDPQYIILT